MANNGPNLLGMYDVNADRDLARADWRDIGKPSYQYEPRYSSYGQAQTVPTGTKPDLPASGPDIPWKHVGAGLLTLAGFGGAIGSMGGTEAGKTAMDRYKELSDFNSGYWQTLRGMYSSMYGDIQPTISTLYGFGKTHGLTDQSSMAVALQRAKETELSQRSSVQQALIRQWASSQDTAAQYLSMAQRDELAAKESGSSFWNQAIGLGGTLLSLL